MVASRDGLFLLGVACASPLLSSAVGITSACLDHFMHLTFRNARIIAQRSTLNKPWPTARYAARFAQLRRRAAAVARQRPLCGSSISFDQYQSQGTTHAASTHNTQQRGVDSPTLDGWRQWTRPAFAAACDGGCKAPAMSGPMEGTSNVWA